MQLLQSYTRKVAQCSSKMAPSCFLCTFPQQPHKPEEINFLCSASLLCGLSLPEQIIIVFHTLPPAVGTHLDNYMQYSGEESILHNSANWARSREWLTAIFTSQSDSDEEQNLNVTFKNLHLLVNSENSMLAYVNLSASHLRLRTFESVIHGMWLICF